MSTCAPRDARFGGGSRATPTCRRCSRRAPASANRAGTGTPQKHSAPECWSLRRAASAAERRSIAVLECRVYRRFAVTSQSKLPWTRRRRQFANGVMHSRAEQIPSPWNRSSATRGGSNRLEPSAFARFVVPNKRLGRNPDAYPAAAKAAAIRNCELPAEAVCKRIEACNE